MVKLESVRNGARSVHEITSFQSVTFSNRIMTVNVVEGVAGH